MTAFDAAFLITACVMMGLCAWRGFFGTLLRFGAWVISVILARFIGVAVSAAFFDASLLATFLATGLSFALLSAVLSIVARIASKALVKVLIGKTVDRILGAALGLAITVGFACAVAFAIDTAQLLIPALDIRSVVDESIIFKYFF